MSDLQVLNTSGKSKGKVKLAKEIFSVKPNPKLTTQAIRVYLANNRQASAKVKTRSEVKGSGRKIWRQKGTGRARHGDRYAPIFVGGGIAHGPTGKQNTKLKLSQKMRRKALITTLSQKLNDQELVIVDGLDKLEPKTKIINQKLQNILKSSKKDIKKISIILSDKSQNIRQGSRNINSVTLLSAKNLNAYQILNSGLLIIMKDALDLIEQKYSKKNQKITQNIKSKTKKITSKKTDNSKTATETKKTKTTITKKK